MATYKENGQKLPSIPKDWIAKSFQCIFGAWKAKVLNRIAKSDKVTYV
jgi:hypothetical protein